MTKFKLAILDDYQGVVLTSADWTGLASKLDITVFRDTVTGDALAARLQPFDIICLMRERSAISGALLAQLPNLKFIVSTGKRNPVLDLAAAEARGIVVSCTGGSGHGVVELAWSLILALARHLPQETASLRSGGWQVGVGADLHGRTLGLLGLGHTGSAMARIAQGFGMEVIAWSQNLNPDKAAEHGAELVSKDELVARSDFLSIHLVLGPRSRGLVGMGDLAAMKPTAYLINTSRGPIVDEAALIEILTQKRIAGAGLDVFDREPLPADHPFRTLPNVIATPHIGYVTEAGYGVFYREMVEDIEAFLAGHPIRIMA